MLRHPISRAPGRHADPVLPAVVADQRGRTSPCRGRRRRRARPRPTRTGCRRGRRGWRRASCRRGRRSRRPSRGSGRAAPHAPTRSPCRRSRRRSPGPSRRAPRARERGPERGWARWRRRRGGAARGPLGRIRPRQARREIGFHAGHVRAGGQRLGEGGVGFDLDHVEEEVAAERGAGGAQAFEQRRLRRGGVRAQRLVHVAAALGPIADRGGARKVGLLAQDDEHRRALARRPSGENAGVDARRGGLGGADQGEEQ